jgi:hypothetical protein
MLLLTHSSEVFNKISLFSYSLLNCSCDGKYCFSPKTSDDCESCKFSLDLIVVSLNSISNSVGLQSINKSD